MAKNGNSKWITGRVARIVRDRGFGFLAADDNPKSQLFFHYSAMALGAFDNLQEGDRVRWVVADQAHLPEKLQGKGPRAEAVEKIS